MRNSAAAKLARHEAGDHDDPGSGERRDDMNCNQAVAQRDAQERREPADQRRVIDVAGLEGRDLRIGD